MLADAAKIAGEMEGYEFPFAGFVERPEASLAGPQVDQILVG